METDDIPKTVTEESFMMGLLGWAGLRNLNDGESSGETTAESFALQGPRGHEREQCYQNLLVKEELQDKHCGHRQRNTATAKTSA